jgi:HAAS domain-containing protein
MTSADAYLAEVRRSMAGMDPRVRDDILRELRSHVVEASAANGGDSTRAIAGMGSAREVGRTYRKLYGYGPGFQGLFVALAAVLALFSVPVLFYGDTGAFPLLLSLPVLVILLGWLLWVSVAAGARVGLYAGVVSFAVRIVAALAVDLTTAGASTMPGGLLFFILSSVLLVLVAWLPGTAKKVWSAPTAEL